MDRSFKVLDFGGRFLLVLNNHIQQRSVAREKRLIAIKAINGNKEFFERDILTK